MSPDPGGLPRYPIKAVIPVAFFLLLVQGLSLFIRSLAVITGHDGPGTASAPHAGGHV
jgi:TRAP-type mannitol/chloroaromatic compound transport system permease small subunit